MRELSRPVHFILSAEDDDLACSVLQMRFTLHDPLKLVELIPDANSNDPEIWNRSYDLNETTWRKIVTAFGIAFDTSGLIDREFSVCVWRLRSPSDIPYLIHTGYELLLLLNGQKKLARMGDSYPPMTFPGEAAFNKRVTSGELHREEVIEPFEKPIRQWIGKRTVYYTLKGEEWRIPASKLIWSAFSKSGGWNESYERLEGMLFGYEDWQNDWWANWQKRRGSSFYGIPFCCAVTKRALAWIESAGFKALPPIIDEGIDLYRFDFENAEQPNQVLGTNPQAFAVIRFSARGRSVNNNVDFNLTGPWRFSADEIPGLNQDIRGSLEVILTRT